MTFAVIDWLSISINLLLVVFVIVCLLMTLLILMQRPKQEGLGAAFGSGVTDQVFGARTTNVLQRGTVYLGSLFFVLSLTLAVLIGHQNKKTSILKPKEAVEKEVKAIVPETPVAPKSLSEELPIEDSKPLQNEPVAPDISSVPSAPAAPAEVTPVVPADAAVPVAPVTPDAPAVNSEEKSGQP